MSNFRTIANEYMAANENVKPERDAFKQVCTDFVKTVKDFSKSKQIYGSGSSWKWDWVYDISYVSHNTFMPLEDGRLYFDGETQSGKDIFVTFDDFENIKQVLEKITSNIRNLKTLKRQDM